MEIVKSLTHEILIKQSGDENTSFEDRIENMRHNFTFNERMDQLYHRIQDISISDTEKIKILFCGLIATTDINNPDITKLFKKIQSPTNEDDAFRIITNDWQKQEEMLLKLSNKPSNEEMEKYKMIFYIQSCIF